MGRRYPILGGGFMPTLYEHIGHRIRQLRNAYPKGALSQEGLAAQLKVASNTVSRWETGTYKPTPKDLEALARFFSVSMTTFFPDRKSTRLNSSHLGISYAV